MIIKKIWSLKGVGHVLSFLGEKNSSLLSLLGNQRISIAIQWCGWVRWQLEFFDHFEGGTRDGNQNLQLPSNTPSQFDGDQNFSRHKGGRPKSFGCHTLSHFWGDQKNLVAHPYGDQNILVTIQLSLLFE
jgi:hypothetical protein